MNYFRPALNLFAILALSVAVSAQKPSPAGETNSATTGRAGKGNISIPAEKLAPVRIPIVSSAPTIDGRLSEEIWRGAAVFKDFYQTMPGDNTAPSKQTEAYVVYDRENLYIAFKCWDEPDKIRASYANRDDVFREDNVRVWLDTFNDRRRAYLLGFNPFGIQQDGIFTEGGMGGGQGRMGRGGGDGDFSVDIIMESKGVIEEWGWSVEVKIPFKSLRYEAGNGKSWGFNVARNIDRFNDELDQWMPDDKSKAGTLIKHGRITGLDDIKTERTLEIVPSATLSETGQRVSTIPKSQLIGSSFDPGRFVNAPVKKEIGVTLKYTLSPNIVLDAAINPDFAEIEADAPVVTANQRFPIFFEEKRPFFLEGADIFKTPINLFYSRTIVDPDAAIKLSGKSGRSSFGLLGAFDKAPGNYSESERNEVNTRPAINEFLDKRAFFGVARFKRDFGTENSIGFLSTVRSFPEQKNVNLAVDARIKWSPRTVSTFQVVGTNSKRCFYDNAFEPLLNPTQQLRNQQLCGGGTYGGVTVLGSSYSSYRIGNGLGYEGSFDFTERNYGFNIRTNGRTKLFRADSGFIKRNDTNQISIGGRISSSPKSEGRLLRASWFNSLESNFAFNGDPQLWMLMSRLGLQLSGSANLSVWGGFANEHLYEYEFGLKRMPSRPDGGAFYGAPVRDSFQEFIGASFDKRFSKKIATSTRFTFTNNEIDFDFGNGKKYPRVSPAALLGSSQYDPGNGKQIEFNQGFSFNPVDSFRTEISYNRQRLTRNDNGRVAFDSQLFGIKTTYQFSRFVFVRARIDYNSIAATVNGQYLFGYTPNPGTAFYVGYNDSLNYNGYNPFTGQYESGINRSSRTFFIRASYLIRKSFKGR